MRSSPPSSEADARTGTRLLLVVNGVAGSALVPVEGDTTLVFGRAPPSDVVIPDDSVSRRHARLVIRGQRRTLEDLGSRNGTFVQGRRLAKGERAQVELGAAFELGSASVIVRLPEIAPLLPTEVTRPRPLASLQKRASSQPPAPIERIVHDAKMADLYALLDVIAPSPLSVLLLGETGVGKQVYAEAVHEHSTRRGGPFLQLNCAALPESILESELFGYEKGAFTGAVASKAGLVESADGGTAFLDEIGEVPLAMQAKLLRVLESGQVMRLGSVKLKHVDVRFVSATNRDPRRLVAEGRFRADFYFRLNGMTVTIPPLRERRTEIAPLARSMLAHVALLTHKHITLTERAVDALLAYDWPGNIRELKNVIERAAVMCAGDILDLDELIVADPEAFGRRASVPEPAKTSSPLPASPTSTTTGSIVGLASLREQWNDREKTAILDALTKTGWNQSRAAKLLGMSRHTLIARIERYGFARPRGKA